MLVHIFAATTSVLLFIASPAVIAQDGSHPPAKQQTESDSAIETAADNVRVNQLVNDEAIGERLERILNSTEWFQSVDIRVENRIVFLRGKPPILKLKRGLRN